jgi:TRAP-type mannitol/chloroaromatic compound transport system permease small subunit
MSYLLAFSAAIDRLNRGAAAVADWMVLAAVLISAGNALSRYAFSLSSNAWLEIQWYLFGALFMLGAAFTLKLNEHVRVDLVYLAMSPRRRIWMDLFGFVVLMLPATIVLLWLSWPVFWDSFVRGEHSNNAGGLPRWPLKLFLPLGFALLALQGLSETIKRIAILAGIQEPEDPDYKRPDQ